MPNFEVAEARISGIGKIDNNTPRQYGITIVNINAPDNSQQNILNTLPNRVDVTYYKTATQTQTISYVPHESQSVVGFALFRDNSNAIKSAVLYLRDFETNILKLNTVTTIRLTFVDSTVGKFNITNNKRIYQPTPTTIAVEFWSSYFASRSFTGQGINYENTDLIFALTHNVDTSNAIIQITGITNTTGVPAGIFPITLTPRPIERRVNGQFNLDANSQFQINVFPYNLASNNINVDISASGATTVAPIIVEDVEVLPTRQRFAIQSAFINESDTGLILQCVSYPNPIPEFSELIIQKSTNPLFPTPSTRSYTSQSSTNVYGDSLPAQGTTYYRIVVKRTGFADLITNVWKITRRINDYTFEEILDYADLLSGMKVSTIDIEGTSLTFRIEDDNFISQPIASITITATATNQTTRTATGTLSGDENFVHIKINQLAANTNYDFKFTASVNNITYDILSFPQNTGSARPAQPTPEQERVYVEEKLIRENLLNEDATNLLSMPQECHDRFIEYMLSLKSVYAGNYHGPDKNPKNLDLAKPQQKRATRYPTDTKINIDDLVSVISVAIPEPDEDNDLIIEAEI